MLFGLVSYQSCVVPGSLPGLGGDGTEAPGEEKLSGPSGLRQMAQVSGAPGRGAALSPAPGAALCWCCQTPAQLGTLSMLPIRSQRNVKALGSSQKQEPTQV